jgi:hypothetical protein
VQHVFRSFTGLIARHGRLVFVKLMGPLRTALDRSSIVSSILLADSFTEACEKHLVQVCATSCSQYGGFEVI